MKSLSWVLGVLLTLFITNGANATSNAASISLSQVGSVDKLVGWTNLGNSGDGTEIAWVDSVLNGNYVFKFKTDFSDPTKEWMPVSGVKDTFAYLLDTPVEYFLIKTGNNGSNQPRDFLFQNLDGLDYAVIDLDLKELGYNIEDIKNIGKLSHIDGFNDPPVRVPEPTTFFLLIVGITGLAWRKRA